MPAPSPASGRTPGPAPGRSPGPARGRHARPGRHRRRSLRARLLAAAPVAVGGTLAAAALLSPVRDHLDLRVGPMAPGDSAARGASDGADRGPLRAVQVADGPASGTAGGSGRTGAGGSAGRTGGSDSSTVDEDDRTPASAAPAGGAGDTPGSTPGSTPTSGSATQPAPTPTDEPESTPEETPEDDGPLQLPTLPVTPSAAVTFPGL